MKKNFKLDKDREFRFDHLSACAFEEQYSNSIINATKRVGPLVVNTMVWATVRHLFQDRLTPEQAKTLIQKFIDRGGDMSKLLEFLMDGWKDAGVIGRESEEHKSLTDLDQEARDNPGDPTGSAPSSSQSS